MSIGCGEWFFLEHFHLLNLRITDKTEKRQRSILLFSVPVNVMLINRGSESSASRTTFSRLPYFCPPLPPDSHPSLSCSRLQNKNIALKSEPLRTLRRAHWSGIPLKQVCKFCREQGSQQRPSLFSRQIFLTVGRLVSGTVTHGCSGEQNGGHWCSNYGLYFFQILVLCKILRAAFRDTLYFFVLKYDLWQYLQQSEFSVTLCIH